MYKKLYVIPCKTLGDYVALIYAELYPDCPVEPYEYNEAIKVSVDILSYYFGMTNHYPDRIPMMKSIQILIGEIDDVITGYIGSMWEEIAKLQIRSTASVLYIYT